MTLTDEIGLLLDELGVGEYRLDGSAGGNLFATSLPLAPDVALAIALYGDGADALGGLPEDDVRVQLRIRGTKDNPAPGEALAQAAYDALNGLMYRALPGGTWLQMAVCQGGAPAYIGRDENGRHEWTVNVRLVLERPTTARPGF
ncbi:minor capsid protein [Nocardiopsis changdeensis]|uniref:Tail terminator n=1 Tax=Nocardiopsis changdeensis TaxID=2831969 RepID=A0ABX8BLU5_9ACTN|nr:MULTISPECIES: minor capsid protein [Nocardiopsis]QUX22977.1 hypothetical protein KGD84_00770 [Nocardiopsis changdeensis]QYX38920.1 minor capsid protein [Nocardiopsis sp. MT53]